MKTKNSDLTIFGSLLFFWSAAIVLIVLTSCSPGNSAIYIRQSSNKKIEQNNLCDLKMLTESSYDANMDKLAKIGKLMQIDLLTKFSTKPTFQEYSQIVTENGYNKLSKRVKIEGIGWMNYTVNSYNSWDK